MNGKPHLKVTLSGCGDCHNPFKTYNPGSSIRDLKLGVEYVLLVTLKQGLLNRDLHLGDQKVTWKEAGPQIPLKLPHFFWGVGPH